MLNALENSEAEQAVLSSILYEPELIDECTLSVEHFSNAAHKTIFGGFKRLQEKSIPVDPVTLAKELGDGLAQAGGLDYLTQLIQSVATTAHFEYYQRLVSDSYKLRKAQDIAQKFVNEPSEESMDELAKSMDELTDETAEDDEETTDDVLVSIHDDMFIDRGDISGVVTGSQEVDNMTSGLQDGELIIIAGRPSMGKSAFAINVAMNAADHDTVVNFFSLEMPKKMVIQRILSAMMNIDAGKWKNPNRFMTDTDKRQAMDGMGRFKEWNLHIHDTPSQTVADIRSKVRKSLKQHPNKKHLVVIDYLTFMKSSGRYERRDLEVGAITRSLKQLARRYEIPVILLSQLSRGVEQRQDKRPMMSDLRESGSIEQDADLIMFLYRDEYYNKESENKNITEIIIAKQRNGPVGTVEMAFLKEYGRFVNLDRKHEVKT